MYVREAARNRNRNRNSDKYQKSVLVWIQVLKISALP